MFPLEAITERRRTLDNLEHNYGIYFLFLGDELQYVGQAKDITDRLIQHRYPNRPSLVPATWFDSASTIEIEDEMFWNAVECYYIHTFKPPRNVKYPLKHGMNVALFL